MKRIILNEGQVEKLILFESSQVLSEAFKDVKNYGEMIEKIKKLIQKGVSITAIIFGLIHTYDLGYSDASSLVSHAQEMMRVMPKNDSEWELVADDVLATVYNAVPEQCNSDVTHTASMFRLNLSDVLSHRIIAMERTMMSKFGLKYGDIVKIEGTGKWDGEWQIQDTMNKRFAGQHKIDILIPKSAGLGEWKNVKVYKLNDPDKESLIRSEMAPQLSKAEAMKQINKIKNGEMIHV